MGFGEFMAWSAVEGLHNLDKTTCSIRLPMCYSRNTVYQEHCGQELEEIVVQKVYPWFFIHGLEVYP